jgi:hypothetical protein
MITEHIIRTFDNNASEITSTLNGCKKIIYNTGDVVYFYNDLVVIIVSYDGILYQINDTYLQNLVVNSTKIIGVF